VRLLINWNKRLNELVGFFVYHAGSADALALLSYSPRTRRLSSAPSTEAVQREIGWAAGAYGAITFPDFRLCCVPLRRRFWSWLVGGS